MAQEAKTILTWPLTIMHNLQGNFVERDLAKMNLFRALVIMIGGTYVLAPRTGTPMALAATYLVTGWFVESSNI